MTNMETGTQFKLATFGAGCFWGVETRFREVEGVEDAAVGYTGGTTEQPDYRSVCSGQTGHAEVVQVSFDPGQIEYADLLRIFFEIHDPTTPNRQGADVGPQYRSIILTHSDEQETVARQVIRDLEDAESWSDPVVTEVAPLTAFYPAESVHQDYYRRNSTQPYCRVVIDPKLAKFRRSHPDRIQGAS